MKLPKSLRTWSVALTALTLLAANAAFALETAKLVEARPFRLQVSPSGSPQRVDVRGENFEDTGHPIRDQYMHWQIRRDDGGWQPCTQRSVSSAAICHGTGFTAGMETLEIGGSYLAREGFIELRVFRSLADEAETDPRRATTPTDWSNVLRVPVVIPGPAPQIRSLSRKTFPLSGAPADYQFTIDTSGVVGQPEVVFRGDVVVWPERVDGPQIQVSVPAVYRRTSAGELSLTVRTAKGGDSAPVYIQFVEPPKTSVSASPVRRIEAPSLANGKKLSAAAAAPIAVAPGVIAGDAACQPGFVWREATPADRVCVTPETRTRAARQNAEGPNHRLPNGGASGPNTCQPGYVWRDAVKDDFVCVTPAERGDAAEDNRLAPTRVQR